jgi:putative MATE family efflux protein
MDAQEKKYRAMTEPPVEKLICKLAVPCIISMLVTSFYNMADTYFVGVLNDTAATGAVGVVFSMMAIIQAVGFFFGQGSGTFISRALGEKNYEDANHMAATGFLSSLVIGAVICVLGQIFLEPLAYLLGSTDTILPYTRDYLRVILVGAPWMTASFVLNNQLRFQGGAMYAMVGITTGAILNIILDPLMILPQFMNMGVAGAGWATIISQFVSFCLLLAGCSRGSNIRIKIKNFRLKWYYYYQIFRGGLPSLARQCLASLATICLNNVARPMGDAVIAAMGVVQRISMFGASAMLGFGQGFQPVCGFNYGAGLYERVKKGFWFCVKASTGVLVVIAAAGFVFAEDLVALFRDDPAVIACGAAALRFQCITFPFHGWIVMSNMMEQSMGRTIPATFLSVARQGFFFIPLVLTLPVFFDQRGVEMTQACADALTMLFAIPIHFYVMKTMEKGKK